MVGSPAVRGACSTVLSRAGFAVSEAVDGEQAWERLQAADYRLLITDHAMPKVTGSELVRRARAAGMTLPVILISGMATVEREFGDVRHFIAFFLPKPFSVLQLLNRVNAVLDSHPA